MLVKAIVLYAREVTPGLAAGPHEHGEDLLAGPQLHGLEQGGLRQLDAAEGIAHLADQLPHLRPGVEAVLACQQVARRQKVLHCQTLQ